MRGTIKTLVSAKGYGFIRSKNKEYFFHKDDFKESWDDLVEDYDGRDRSDPIEVEFDHEDTKKGPRAVNVKRAEFPSEGVG